MEIDTNLLLDKAGIRLETLIMFGKKIEGHPLAIHNRVAEYGLALNLNHDNVPESARRIGEPAGTTRYFVFNPHADSEGGPGKRTIVVGEVLFFGSTQRGVRENFYIGTWDTEIVLQRMNAVKEDIPDAEMILCDRLTDHDVKYHARTPLAYICETRGIDLNAAIRDQLVTEPEH